MVDPKVPDVPHGVLMPAEWVRARTGLNRRIYLPALVIGILWMVVFVWAAIADLWAVALLAAIVVCLMVPALVLHAWLRHRASMVLLTNRRVIAVTGPLPRRVASLPLADIDRVHVQAARGLFGWRRGPAVSFYAVPLRDRNLEVVEMHDLAGADVFEASVRAVLLDRQASPTTMT